ncbi:MAG: competence type IV pilus major pilin ComGC [Coriobacteriia bacterium]
MRWSKEDEGFTLVELMIVALIISALVALAIPVFNSASARSRLRTCHASQRTIEGAVQQWLASGPANRWTARLIDGSDPLSAGGAFLKAVPHCPAGTVDDFYSVDGSGAVDGDSGASWLSDGSIDHAHF